MTGTDHLTWMSDRRARPLSGPRPWVGHRDRIVRDDPFRAVTFVRDGRLARRRHVLQVGLTCD